MDINTTLEKLNKDQIKPVLDTEGNVLVIAGAGSGKTRVLTARIAYLAIEKNISPENILAITFTNKAANEMKERLSKMIEDVSSMWVCTIHSMCVKILRQFIDRLGYDKSFTIYDETDKDKVLKRVFEALGYEQDKFLKLYKNIISSAKNDCLSPEDFYIKNRDMQNINEFIEVYTLYEKTLAQSNALDFDDLLFKTYQLFKQNPDVVKYYASRFKYVHIDEFQDTNKVQFVLAKALSSFHCNLFVVGDDDQSIYSWRGAKIENILDFDKVFSNAKVYKLEQNYRSTKKILELANCIIANNTGRRGKELWTDNNDGAKIETFVGTDENNEATFTAMQIKNLVSRGAFKYSDFAVFMRINAISRPFEQEFTKYGIPYKVYGGFRFFERKEIKDVLSYLKIIANNRDDESFLRAVASPKRGIGDTTLSKLKEFATSRGCSIFEVIDDLFGSGINNASISKLVNFKNLLLEFSDYIQKNGISKGISHIVDATSFALQFEEKTEENMSKIYNINELINSAEQFEKENYGSYLLVEYLNSVTLSSDTDDINDGEFVTLATIHASKGLEYNCVFVAGLDEGVLPTSRSYNDSEEMEEERRLMYVAVTRAMQRLYLTRAMSRFMYGRREHMVPSRFLKEARPVLAPKMEESIQKNSYKTTNYSSNDDILPSSTNFGGYSSSYAKSILKSHNNNDNVNKDYSKYKTGTKVKHAKFGEGVIIMVKGAGEGITVDVAFRGIGIKSLSVKYAPMEIL